MHITWITQIADSLVEAAESAVAGNVASVDHACSIIGKGVSIIALHTEVHIHAVEAVGYVTESGGHNLGNAGRLEDSSNGGPGAGGTEG